MNVNGKYFSINGYEIQYSLPLTETCKLGLRYMN